jgi:hypothetical protein
MPNGPQQRAQHSVKQVLAIVPFLLALTATSFMPANLRAQQVRDGGQHDQPLPVSPARISDHEIEALVEMQPQQQAMRLLERAINHYDGAQELIRKYLDSWQGSLQLTPELDGLITTAINSDDLQVRAAALDISLAANNLPKSTETAEKLIERIRSDTGARAWGFWMLGALGYFRVEPDRIFQVLLDYQHDPHEETRSGVVSGLAYLGSDNTIQPLLDIYLHDKSTGIREQALGSIAQVGMLSKPQRMMAVPDLLKLCDDLTIEAGPRKWVFQALRDVTGVDIGNDPAAWRAWWAERGIAPSLGSKN